MADEHDLGVGGQCAHGGDDVPRRAVGGELREDLDARVAADGGADQLGGLERTDEGARVEVGRTAIVPPQALAERTRLCAPLRGEVTMRIAKLDGFVDGLGVTDQEHLHAPSIVARMKLYGTTTSPFVRRVRVVAAEVGEPVERIDTATEAGQALLREVSPIRKVPVAEIDGRTLFDSRVIIEWLVTTRGWGGISPPRDVWRTRNLSNAVDDALESVIQTFYLKRDDNVAWNTSTFATRQVERADSIFAWLATQLAPDGKSFGDGFGLAELSLVCALEWMDFRQTYPTERASALAGVRAAWSECASVAATRPHA